MLKNQKNVFGLIPRRGMAYCKWTENKILFFGGVTEVVQENFKFDNTSGLSIYHNDIICLDL